MISYKSLSKGERFWLNRRRLGKTQFQASKLYKVSEDKITAWENERDAESCPHVVLHAKLTTGEALALARRRKGWDIRQAARKMRVSHVTLIKWEDDRNSTQEQALQWWDKQGWPLAPRTPKADAA